MWSHIGDRQNPDRWGRGQGARDKGWPASPSLPTAAQWRRAQGSETVVAVARSPEPTAQSLRGSGACPRAGMTLIELMLAMTLFSAMLASVGGLIRSGLKAQARWGSSLAPYRQLEQGLAVMARDVESAQPLFDLPCEADERHVRFAQVARTSQGEPDWFSLTYEIGEWDGQPALIRERRRWRDGAAAVAERELMLRMSGGRFAFGMRDAQDAFIWSETWDGQAHGMPRLIRLEATVPVGAAADPLSITHVLRAPAGALPRLEETP